ncbi:MAG: EamA family transporter [Mangrovibacterium sp.]
MWITLALISAFLLGIYDVFKKISLDNNAVLPVLFASTITAAIIVTPIIILSPVYPHFFQAAHIYVPRLTPTEHLMVLGKAVIVVSGWVFAFYALRNLPITIVTPIRATGPLWTLIGAIFIFQERLNPLQWLGVAVTLCFFYLLSTAGKLEGINFKRNKWIYFIVIGTLLGSSSGLWDKFILKTIDRVAVQAWFSFYQVIVMLPVMFIFRWAKQKEYRSEFEWRWSIPLIAIFLLFADYAYFYSLSIPESMISIVSALRRGGVLVAFVIGAFLFKEQNIKQKGIYLLGILLGILLISLGS